MLSLDYSLGLIDNNFNQNHHISLSFHFGGPVNPKEVKVSHQAVALNAALPGKKEPPSTAPAWMFVQDPAEKADMVLGRQKLYEVKDGDTLQSISQKMYGNERGGREFLKPISICSRTARN